MTFKRSGKSSIDTAENLIRKYREGLFDRNRARFVYSQKIDNYISTATFENLHQYCDYSSEVYIASNEEDRILKRFFADNYEKIITKYNKNILHYVIRKKDPSTYSCKVGVLYGTENECFYRTICKKALFTKWVPHVVEGNLVGKCDLEMITKVIFLYDREYGLFLKQLVDEKRIDPNKIFQPIRSLPRL